MNSAQGYAYALMEPEEQIAVRWGYVCESWRKADKNHVPVPYCGPPITLLSVPVWWHHRNQTAGTKAWQKVLAEYAKHQEEEGEDDETPPPPKQTKPPKGKGKQGPSANQDPGKLGAQGRGARAQSPQPREADEAGGRDKASTSKSVAPPSKSGLSPTRTVLKRPSANMRSGFGGKGASVPSESETPSRISEHDSGAPGTPPLKRARMMIASELAGTTDLSAAFVSPGKDAVKDRMQRESEPFYSPGPSTQQANALPRLTADGKDPVITFVEGFSSPIEPGKPVISGVRPMTQRANSMVSLIRPFLAAAGSEPGVPARPGCQGALTG